MSLRTQTKNTMHITVLVFFKQINQRGYSIDCTKIGRKKWMNGLACFREKK